MSRRTIPVNTNKTAKKLIFSSTPCSNTTSAANEVPTERRPSKLKRQIPIGIAGFKNNPNACPTQSARANDSKRSAIPTSRASGIMRSANPTLKLVERREASGMPVDLQTALRQPVTPGTQRRFETSTTTIRNNDVVTQRTERQISTTSSLKQQQHTQIPKQSKPMSPIKQFDTAVTAELKRQRGDDALQVNPALASNITSLAESPVSSRVVDKSTSHSVSVAVSKSWLQQDNLAIQSQIIDESALTEAVGKLIQAEAVCRFDGAVRAAELAAESAPPELVEEAACAGARGYQATLVDTIQERLPGLKPIEVLGYIGITRPRH